MLPHFPTNIYCSSPAFSGHFERSPVSAMDYPEHLSICFILPDWKTPCWFRKSPRKLSFTWQYPFLFMLLPCLLSAHMIYNLAWYWFRGDGETNFLTGGSFQNRTNGVEHLKTCSETGWSTKPATGSPKTWGFINYNCLHHSSLDIDHLHLFNTRPVVLFSTKLHRTRHIVGSQPGIIPQFKANHNQFAHMHSTGKLIFLLWILKRRRSV